MESARGGLRCWRGTRGLRIRAVEVEAEEEDVEGLGLREVMTLDGLAGLAGWWAGVGGSCVDAGCESCISMLSSTNCIFCFASLVFDFTSLPFPFSFSSFFAMFLLLGTSFSLPS
jgi:hypothetical protein